MSLETKDFDTLVQDQATAIQSSATAKLGRILDFSVGTAFRSIVESGAGVFLWLQGLVVKLLASTRLSSSHGADVDSFIADYGLSRLPAVKASGEVTFSRNLTDNTARINVGTVVQTKLTSVKFAVVADESKPYFDPILNAYIMSIGTANIDVKVEAVIPGVDGNVSENTITVIPVPISYVDFVTNASAYSNGEELETDGAVKARFVDYINSLSKATKVAIEEAVSSVKSGISYGVIENIAYDTGQERLGYFFVVIDDKSGGAPTPELIASVYNAVDRVRAFTTYFEVKAADRLAVDVTVKVYVNTSQYDVDAIKEAAEDAIQVYLKELGIGETLYYTRLIQVLYDSSAAIQDVNDLAINGGVLDIVADYKETVVPQTVTVTVESL